MNKVNYNFSILGLVNTLGETSAPLNEHFLPRLKKDKIIVCSFYKPDIKHSKDINVFHGNGTIVSFFKALKRSIDKEKPDIIHVHNIQVGFLLMVYSLFNRSLPLRRLIFTVHNSYDSLKLRNKVLILFIYFFYSKIICCGIESYNSVPYIYKLIGRKRITTITNGVNTQRIDSLNLSRKKNTKKSKFNIIWVGRLIDIKNPITMIKAIDYSNIEANISFIGAGELANDLAEIVQELNLSDKIKFKGLINRDDVYKHMFDADVFVSTSYSEGLPVAVLEAMACKCPVILSDIMPHREIADGADFISLIEPDDYISYANELRRFHNMEESERVEIGKRGRHLVNERFSLISMLDKYDKVYKSMLEDS